MFFHLCTSASFSTTLHFMFSCPCMFFNQLGGRGPRGDNAICLWMHAEDAWESHSAQRRYLQNKRCALCWRAGTMIVNHRKPSVVMCELCRWKSKDTQQKRMGFIDINVVFPAVGVTNQRETTLVWDKKTGEPLYNAIGEWSAMG